MASIHFGPWMITLSNGLQLCNMVTEQISSILSFNSNFLNSVFHQNSSIEYSDNSLRPSDAVYNYILNVQFFLDFLWLYLNLNARFFTTFLQHADNIILCPILLPVAGELIFSTKSWHVRGSQIHFTSLMFNYKIPSVQCGQVEPYSIT